MNALLKYKEHIKEIKQRVENSDYYYSHHIINYNNNHVIDENTISIVMTSSNRSKQVYFTLLSMLKSGVKNIHIIIVDDSDISKDPVNLNVLKNYPFYIDFIVINREKKDWLNPLVNYNIGFKFIKGSKIVIQNSEVCHVGNVLQFFDTQMQDNNYYVCDIKASLNFDTNEKIYGEDLTNAISLYSKEELFYTWYQCRNFNRNYHFLVGLTSETFKKINNFNYDLTMGYAYDDNDFLLKIISKNINIVNLFHEDYHFGGIHLFHSVSNDACVESNEEIHNKKKAIYNETGVYFDVIENDFFFNKFMEK